ncbi:hypothetical protein N7468_002183 [Penicillium chermesinum]|uniref:ER-bound oxygenase mpaB/mpaB'/Rubber oxygenase catalytic domain-containing protein n=1 Tax=Penicillium chermesinum TaxID=63820 RepID=A0A9W9PI49_9EURO|nr:uncharacterized protein N7468_002183 [Penicillium chermesinum]KAJ5247200.1 hypothetical protein N7468_002183 [Penicillium chermesinum]KAJ6145444.1 hypothetical protein N7470_009339 [Penicillium chermesinum]
MDNATTVLASQAQSLTEAAKVFLDKTPKQWLPYAVGLLVGYPLLTNALRYRRLRKLHKKYPYPTRESLAQMTDDEAYAIQKELGELEFPMVYLKSLQFALFRVPNHLNPSLSSPSPSARNRIKANNTPSRKTYGIPSISHVLTKTSQFSNPETSLKRYTDTSALIQEMMAHNPTSHRAFVSLARTRFLHSGYRSSGRILESDMLYTLALFALQPVRFVSKYEWRELSDLERCAIGTFWKSIGDALGISFEELPSGKTGFKDGIQWLEEVDAWSEVYEQKYMVPDQKNRETADQTTDVLLYMLPKALHPLGLQFVSFMMDDRLRKAMLYEPPSPFAAAVFDGLFKVRKFVLRYLMLPRPYFLRLISITPEPDANDRYFLTSWEAAPYYVKPTFWNRWGPTAWFTWMMGRPVPGDEGDKYRPEGYHIANIGPRYFEGKGQKEVEKLMEEMKVYRTGKCPFH